MTRFALSSAAALILSAPAFADHHGDKDKGHAVKMEQIDTNNDGRVDFTEFSNHFETVHGWSAGESAREYVRLADESGTLDEAALAKISLDGMTTVKQPMPELPDAVTVDMPEDDGVTEMRVPEAELDLDMDMDADLPDMSDDDVEMNAELSARFGEFEDYDTDGDGSVSFAEYSARRAENDVSATEAAQEFMRVSEGTQAFDEDGYDRALRTGLILSPAYAE
ncbi:MAG: hypothetical protein WBG08_00955 [Litorimonas sp.]